MRFFIGPPGGIRTPGLQNRNVYAPMYKIFCLLDIDYEKKIELTEKIMNNHYFLVPPILLKELQALENNNNDSGEEINKIRLIVGTLYNWTRKKLGYPYDPNKIVADYLPTADKREIASGIAVGILICFWLCSCTISFVYMIGNGQLQGGGWFFTITLIGIFFLCFRLIDWLSNKPKRK